MSTAPAPPSRVVIPHRLDLKHRLMARGVSLFLHASLKTWRCVWKDTADNSLAQAPMIYAVWHERLVMALAGYNDYGIKKWGVKGMVAMVSASRDGAFLSAVLHRFGVETVRGSSSRRGPQALLEAARWLERGYCVIITPDGPRGPARKAQSGVISLAQVSGRPIVGLSGFASPKVRLKSWDRFQVPLPFAKCELYDSNPIQVPRGATDDEREKLRVQLEANLNSITRD